MPDTESRRRGKQRAPGAACLRLGGAGLLASGASVAGVAAAIVLATPVWPLEAVPRFPPALEATPDGQVQVNPDARLQVEFLERVQIYMDARAAALKKLPGREVTAGEDEMLARLIVQSRPRARAGDLFTSDTRQYIRRQIARALAGPDGAQIRASIMDENPGRIQIRINGRYPDSAPLASMPVQVLGMLPKLPTELEYRFIGRRLILLDVDAHLIVDYMDNALQN